MQKLVESLAGHGPLTVVLDGRPFEVAAPADVEVVFAPAPGPGAADDVIVKLVGEDDRPEELEVVTSDRELIRRVEELGARVIPAKRFRSELDGA